MTEAAVITTTAQTEDRWRLGGAFGKQRMIPDPLTGELVAYRSVSTFAKTLDETGGLGYWQAWMAVRGAQKDRKLKDAALHADPDGKTPRRTMEELIDMGGGARKRDRGSARHTLLSMALTGQPLPDMPDDARAELATIVALVDGLGTIVASEAPNVCDEHRLCGKVDLVVRAPDGTPVIVDYKSGSRVDLISWGIQLYAYARSRFFDWDTEERGEPLAPTRPRLVVIHAPQDSTPPRIVDIDPRIARTWFELAQQVHRARQDASTLARRAGA